MSEVRFHFLDDRLWFPDPRNALRGGPVDGLVAIGGDLSLPRMLLAYRSGLFPWTANPVTWWSPDPRGILELNEFHCSKSLRKSLRQFHFTRDTAFREVMAGCAESAPGRTSTWISPPFQRAYEALHEAGYAHSVECWQGEALVGGVYGVQVGGFFAGESMFHRASDASKAALFHLVEHLRESGFALMDIQIVTPHTQQLGARTIPREEYLERLRIAVEISAPF